jgi:hypothetical protein
MKWFDGILIFAGTSIAGLSITVGGNAGYSDLPESLSVASLGVSDEIPVFDPRNLDTTFRNARQAELRSRPEEPELSCASEDVEPQAETTRIEIYDRKPSDFCFQHADAPTDSWHSAVQERNMD